MPLKFVEVITIVTALFPALRLPDKERSVLFALQLDTVIKLFERSQVTPSILIVTPLVMANKLFSDVFPYKSP